MSILTSIGLAVGTSVVASVVGTTLGVVSSIQNSNAQAAQYEYQARVAQENAKIAQEKASAQYQEGLEREREQRMKNLQSNALLKTRLASSGAEIGYGTSLDLIEDSAKSGELDALNIRYDTQQRVQQYREQANSYLNQAGYSNSMSSYTKSNAWSGALTTGLGGLNKITKATSALTIM